MSEHAKPQPVTGEARVRVRYAETDQMGIVYHANYLVWFEVGRVELMRQRGLDYKRLETARYKSPARYDDELIIETRVTAVRGPIIRFGYKIRRANDHHLLCEGETVHVVLGRDMKRTRIPKKYADLLSAAASHPHV